MLAVHRSLSPCWSGAGGVGGEGRICVEAASHELAKLAKGRRQSVSVGSPGVREARFDSPGIDKPLFTPLATSRCSKCPAASEEVAEPSHRAERWLELITPRGTTLVILNFASPTYNMYYFASDSEWCLMVSVTPLSLNIKNQHAQMGLRITSLSLQLQAALGQTAQH